MVCAYKPLLPPPFMLAKNMNKKLIPLALCGLFIFFLSGCESLFFYPDKNLHYHPALCQHCPTNHAIEREDGTVLHGWFFKPKDREIKGVIFYMHGNAQNISIHVNSVLWLVDEGYAIFAFDYGGYGISEGEPSIESVVKDSLTAFDFLLAGQLPSDKIIVLGQSMGGALAVNLAALSEHNDKIAAVIADSPFSSWRRIYREKAASFFLTWPFQYPISWFINDDYAPEKLVPQVPEEIKMLFIHNEGDAVVPALHSQILHNAIKDRSELWLIDTNGHTTALLKKHTQERLLDFLNSL